MNAAWTILRKDMRRFWWEIAVSVGVLGYLSWLDVQRYDFVPGPIEGMLSLLVPAAWAYLIALVVHEDALVGDRQFWITRPYPRGSLLAAKTLFVLLVVHLPAMVLHVVVLLSHNFNPLSHLPQLAWKQVVIASVVTLPSALLAVVTRNLTQFLSWALALAGFAFLIVRTVEPFSAPWIPVEAFRRVCALGLVAIVAGIFVRVQYLRTNTWAARAGASVGIAGACLLYFIVPADTLDRLQCKPSDAPLALQIAPGGMLQAPNSAPARIFHLPVTLQGVPEGLKVRLRRTEARLALRNGQMITASKGRSMLPADDMGFTAHLSMRERDAGELMVSFGRALLPKVRGAIAGVSGGASAMLYRDAIGSTFPPEAAPLDVRDVGRCWSQYARGEYSFSEFLKVICESPAPIPTPTRVVLRSGVLERKHMLGDSMPGLAYPWNTWLSPLHRRQTFFPLVDERPSGPGSEWLTPKDVLPQATLEIGREETVGCQLLPFAFKDLVLRASAPK